MAAGQASLLGFCRASGARGNAAEMADDGRRGEGPRGGGGDGGQGGVMAGACPGTPGHGARNARMSVRRASSTTISTGGGAHCVGGGRRTSGRSDRPKYDGWDLMGGDPAACSALPALPLPGAPPPTPAGLDGWEMEAARGCGRSSPAQAQHVCAYVRVSKYVYLCPQVCVCVTSPISPE